MSIGTNMSQIMVSLIPKLKDELLARTCKLLLNMAS